MVELQYQCRSGRFTGPAWPDNRHFLPGHGLEGNSIQYFDLRTGWVMKIDVIKSKVAGYFLFNAVVSFVNGNFFALFGQYLQHTLAGAYGTLHIRIHFGEAAHGAANEGVIQGKFE